MNPHVQDVYPLSPLQEGLLFHALYDPDSPAYFDQSIIHLRGTVNVPAFVEAWQRTSDRHPILRTAFAWKSGPRPLQIVARTVRVPFMPHDWQSQPDALDEGRLTAFLEADRHQPFNMARAPLFRLSLIRRADDDYVFVWSRHHVLLDGWSLALLLRDVLETYAALVEGRQLPDRPAPPYRDFIDWLGRQNIDEARRFWTAHLAGVTGATALGFASAPQGAGDHDAASYVEVTDTIPAEETAALSAYARRSGLTLNALLQGAWALLMGRATGESDVVFGSTVAGRPATLAGSESIVGLFINTLPVRAAIPGATTAVAWLREFQQQQVEARQHDYASLVAIQGWSGVPRQQPLFETLFVFENYPVDDMIRAAIPGLLVVSSRTVERTHYPLTLIVSPRDTIALGWIADRRRLGDAGLRRWVAAYRTLVGHLVQHGSDPVSSVSCLDAAERTILITTWNQNRLPLPEDACLHDLFEQQSARTPQAVAVIHGVERLTYATLNERADRLAAELRALGVSSETRVAICLSRTVRTVTALLGILKAGGAYVPLDPEYPRERLAFMLRDSGAAILITEQCHANRLPPHGLRVVDLDLDGDGPSTAGVDPASRRCPDNLAYLIYTSGSTGRPKGVAITHRSAVALVAWARTILRDDELARVLASTSLCFDLSVFEIFLTLAAGGAIVLADNVLELPDLPAASEITLVNTVPSAMAELVRQRLLPPSVRTIALAGEPLTTALADRLFAQPAIDRVLDLYGPSETTTYSTWAERTPGGPATIGRPIANTTLYIVDAYLEPAAVGVVGELLIGGAGLARGYLGRPGLTAERFIPDPFSGQPGARVYRTGDLARFRPDGKVEFLGRADHQVKIRGFRIELGEIQARLEEHPALVEVAVVARPLTTGDLGLVAYVVPRGGDAPGSRELRDYLSSRLPAYMVPGIFCHLNGLPRTPNGKLDRRRLPDPAALDAARPDAVAPRTVEEEILAGIWEDVLDREAIGVTDNLFDLGGHSLIATRIVSRVRRVFGVECPLRSVFEHPTIESLARAVGTLSGAPGTAVDVIPSRGATREAPLSFAQQRFWFLQQLDPASAAYNVPVALEMTGTLDVGAFEASLQAVVARHDTLRSAIVSDNGRPSVRVADAAGCPMEHRDLEHLTPADREGAVREFLDTQAHTPIALDRAPLLRVALLTVEPARHVLALTLHHLIADEWSMGVLVRDLSHAYRAIAGGRRPEWTPLAIQYGDFAVWQRGRIDAPAIGRQREYWRRQLAGLEAIDLPTDLARSDDRTPHGLTVTLRLPAALARSVRTFARREGATLYMVMLAVFQALLARYSGQTDIAVGTPIAGRTRSEIEPLVGCFLNTLVLRTHLDGRPTLRHLVARVRETALAAYANQDVPFEELVDALGSGRDLSRHPLVQVTFALERPQALEAALPGIRIAPLRVETKTAKFDLSLVVEDEGEHLSTSLQVSTDLFTETSARRMLEHYRTFIEAAVGEPDVEVAILPVIGPRERRLMTVEWNDTARSYAGDVSVHQLFEQQAARTPDAVAVIFEEEQSTYAELNGRVQRLAHHLRALGVGRGVRVAIAMERSIDLVVGLYGVLAAGGAYVPVDPGYPAERVRFMLEDCRAPVVITHPHLADRLPVTGARILVVDRLEGVTPEGPIASPLSQAPSIDPDDPVYMIYTSGSTGRPNGAINTHRGVVNRLRWMQEALRLDPGDAVLQKTPISFDVSVWEFFWPLMVGARLVLARPDGHKDPAYLVSVIGSQRVTTVHFVPSMLAAFVRVGAAAECPSLRMVVCSGEALGPELRDAFFAQSAAELYNLYGPTEAAVDVTVFHCARGDTERTVPIGRPIANTQVYVLDAFWQLAPQGAPGQLALAGVQLGRGYLDRPDLTAGRFVPNPFGPPGSCMYLTGDLARWREDGNVEFLGRLDHQLKIRGFRVELGEIESALQAHPAVAQCAVMARTDGPADVRLVAYLVGDHLPALGDLRAHLATTLPDYMIPSAFVVLDALPLTPNGKLDRRALPAPEVGRGALAEGPVAPRTSTESALADIWKGVLGEPVVGVHDDFFALGGDSILAIQVVARSRAIGLHLTPRMIFQHRTVAELAAAAAAAEPPVRAGQSAATGSELTPAQRWFFELDLADPGHFNQAVLLVTPPNFDIDSARRAVARLAEHHGALWHTFQPAEAGWRLTPAHPSKTVALTRSAWQAGDRAELAGRLAVEQASLDIERGPLLRVAWLDAGPRHEGRLAIVAHHLVIDAVSWRILLDDLDAIYADPTHALPAATAPPWVWAHEVGSALGGPDGLEARAYWTGVRPIASELPRDFHAEAGANLVATERTAVGRCTREETAALIESVAAAYRMRVDEVLIAATWRAWARWSGRRAVALDLEGHGREDLPGAPDVSRSLGWFTSIVPVVLDHRRDDTPEAWLVETKERLRAMPHHGAGYALLKYLGREPAIRESLAAWRPREMAFNYLGQFGAGAGRSRFAAAPEPVGELRSPRGRRPYLLELNAGIVDGCLEVRMSYSTAFHRPETIESVVADIHQTLRSFSAFCQETATPGFTASDFTEAGLSQDELTRLLARLAGD